jgi:hypothetical protein
MLAAQVTSMPRLLLRPAVAGWVIAVHSGGSGRAYAAHLATTDDGDESRYAALARNSNTQDNHHTRSPVQALPVRDRP